MFVASTTQRSGIRKPKRLASAPNAVLKKLQRRQTLRQTLQQMLRQTLRQITMRMRRRTRQRQPLQATHSQPGSGGENAARRPNPW